MSMISHHSRTALRCTAALLGSAAITTAGESWLDTHVVLENIVHRDINASAELLAMQWARSKQMNKQKNKRTKSPQNKPSTSAKHARAYPRVRKLTGPCAPMAMHSQARHRANANV